MAQAEYTISIELSQTREEVWSVITDFPTYERWNSILSLRKNDNLEVGRKFHVTIHNHGKDSNFKAMTLSNEINHSFSARQRMLGKWFFSATHYFIVEDIGEAEVRFTQQWQLTGIVSKLFRKSITKQLARFKTMNEELKEHLENSSISREPAKAL